jgi:hypothetical protein
MGRYCEMDEPSESIRLAIVSGSKFKAFGSAEGCIS